jgi:hypothetical protein
MSSLRGGFRRGNLYLKLIGQSLCSTTTPSLHYKPAYGKQVTTLFHRCLFSCVEIIRNNLELRFNLTIPYSLISFIHLKNPNFQ